MFIVVEGIDAVGKFTQAGRLVTWCKHNTGLRGTPPLLFSFPRYETIVGKAILRHLHKEIMMAQDEKAPLTIWTRSPEDALAFQCLMLADKVAAAGQIQEHLRRGGDVIADRWWPSAYAYGGSDGLPDSWLLEIHAGLVACDAYVFLDLPPEIALERAVKRAEASGKKVDRYETLGKQTSVRERYMRLAAGNPAWKIIDARGTEDEVFSRIISSL